MLSRHLRFGLSLARLSSHPRRFSPGLSNRACHPLALTCPSLTFSHPLTTSPGSDGRGLAGDRDDQAGFRPITDFDNVRSYLLHRLAGDPALSPEEWEEVLEDITGTLPGRELKAFRPEDEEHGTDSKKVFLAMRKSNLASQKLRPHSRVTYVLTLCHEMAWTGAALSLVRHLLASSSMRPQEHLAMLNLLAEAPVGQVAFEDGDVERQVLEYCRTVEPLFDAADSATRPKLEAYLNAALAKTSAWKETFDRRPSVKYAKDYCRHVAMINFANRALKENDVDVMFAAMEDFNFHKGAASIRAETPRAIEDLALKWLDRCASLPDKGRAVRDLDRLFAYLGSIEYFLPPRLHRKVLDLAGRKDAIFDIQKGSIEPNGHCARTGQTLPSISLTQEEHKSLNNEVVNSVILGEDVYRTTTPGELKRFQKELRDETYDVVVDGLNVALESGLGNRVRTNEDRGRKLLTAVRTMIRAGLTPLVVGRKHMDKYPQMPKIQRECKVIFVQNVTRDDPYVLMAALLGKPGTRFVSNDVLRAHRAHIRPKFDRLFCKWQTGAQIRHEFSLGFNNCYLKFPPRYHPACAQVGGVWHIPLSEKRREKDDVWLMVPPKEWLCLTYK